jgi:DNA-binding transcriptional LysR family regulator
MMQPTFHQLRILTVVAEEGSVTKAAARLHLTQPTLSIQLRQLADTVGEPIIEIVGRRLHLTEVGQEVLTTAREVDDQLNALRSRLSARRKVHGGRLRVAIVSTAESFMPRLLGEFHQTYPGIDIALRVLNRAQVVARLDENADDVYVMTRPPAERGVRAESIGRNPLVVVSAPDHPWAMRTRIRARELEDQAFIVRENGSGTRLWADEWLAVRKVRLQTRMELGSNEAIKQAIRGGFGLAVLSAQCLVLELEQHLVSVLRVSGFPVPSIWYLVTRTSKPLSPVADLFRQFVKQAMPAVVGEIDRVLRAHSQVPGRHALKSGRPRSVPGTRR